MRLGVFFLSFVSLVSGIAFPIPSGTTNGVGVYNGTVASGTVQYHTLTIPSSSAYALEWTLTLTGAARVYANKGNTPYYLSDYDFSNTGNLSPKSLFISACSLDADVWYVAIEATTSSSPYSLTSTTVSRPCFTPLSITNTTDDWTVVDGKLQFYTLTVPSSSAYQLEWTLTLTGSATLYVNRGGTTYYLSDYDYKNTGNLSPKSIFISSCDLAADVWYVAVSGSSGTAAFTLTSVLRYRPCTIDLPLVSTSHNDTATGNSIQLYTFAVPAELGYAIEWTLTLTGSASLYVNRGGTTYYLSDYDYKNTGSISPKSIVINSCNLASDVWYVGVYSTSKVDYTITSIPRNRQCYVPIPLGSANMTDTVPAGQSLLFKITIPSESSYALEWTLTLTGSAGLYVNKGSTTTYLSDYDYKNTGNLSPKTLFFSSCTLPSDAWYVAVSASSKVDFQLSSTTVSRPCVVGVPLDAPFSTSDTVYPGYYQYFGMTIPPEMSQTMEWKITLSNSATQLYVNKGSGATSSNYDFRATNAGAKSIILTPSQLTDGEWYVGIYGSGGSPASFVFTSEFTLHNFTTVLTRGQSDSFTIQAASLVLYYIDIPEGETQPLSIRLDGATNANLYTEINERPYTNSYDRYYTGMDAVKRIVVPVSALAGAPRYYMMVHAPSATANITITLMEDLVPPTIGTVVDGILPLDIQCWSSTTSLSASWYGFSAVSGIVNYEWAIGSTVNSTNILPFTSVGLVNQATANVSLITGRMYYVSVRATSGSGFRSIATSSGVTIDSGSLARGSVNLKSGSIGGTTGLLISWTGFTSVCGVEYFVSIYSNQNSSILAPISVGSASSIFVNSTSINLVQGATYMAKVVALTTSGFSAEATASATFLPSAAISTSSTTPLGQGTTQAIVSSQSAPVNCPVFISDGTTIRWIPVLVALALLSSL